MCMSSYTHPYIIHACAQVVSARAHTHRHAFVHIDQGLQTSTAASGHKLLIAEGTVSAISDVAVSGSILSGN